jgi:hypothetical protein
MLLKAMDSSRPKMEEKISSFIIQKLKAAESTRRLTRVRKLNLTLVKARKAHVQLMLCLSKCNKHN